SHGMKSPCPTSGWVGLVLVVALSSLGQADAPVPEGALTSARRLFQEGKYAESEESFRALLAQQGPAAAVGIARCQVSVGQRDKAVETLKQDVKEHPDSAALPAELARIALARGDFAAASE